MSRSEIATLKILSLNSTEFFDIQSNFQHNFRVSDGFAPDPTRGSTPLVTEPTVWSLFETNSWLYAPEAIRRIGIVFIHA